MSWVCSRLPAAHNGSEVERPTRYHGFSRYWPLRRRRDIDSQNQRHFEDLRSMIVCRFVHFRLLPRRSLPISDGHIGASPISICAGVTTHARTFLWHAVPPATLRRLASRPRDAWSPARGPSLDAENNGCWFLESL
jgi:hypothetical protein